MGEPRGERERLPGDRHEQVAGQLRAFGALVYVPWHYLRHFAATALLEAGEDLFVVSRVLGHKSVATTASFYTHVQPSMSKRSADRMDEVMKRASEPTGA